MSQINMWEIEDGLQQQGITAIAGVDEAGRGPLAGPVCAAAVILPEHLEIPGLNDSKKLTDKKRRELFPIIKEQAIAYGIAFASEAEIDEINILQATFLAMQRAIDQLEGKANFALIDGNREKDFGLPVMTVVKGDSRSANIAAASVLAKVTRDLYMEELAKQTDKLSVEIADNNADSAEAPYVAVCRADGSWSGLAFHGVPGGHEFTSFVLGLYNAAGPGQPLDEAVLEGIRALDKNVDIKVLVSLSCTMCPELVTAAQRLAALNDRVTAQVYDLNHFPAIKDKYNVMSVPCLVINDGEKISFGKKNAQQVLELIR